MTANDSITISERLYDDIMDDLYNAREGARETSARLKSVIESPDDAKLLIQSADFKCAQAQIDIDNAILSLKNARCESRLEAMRNEIMAARRSSD